MRLRQISTLPLALAAVLGFGVSSAFATAELRVAHLSPDAPPVDIFVNGNRVLAGIQYLETSAYLPLDPGTIQVQVTPAGSAAPVVIDAMVTVVSGESYTVAATGLLGAADLQPLVLVDDRVGDPANAKVRFTHASPDAPAVDIAVAGGGPVVFGNVQFRQSTSYQVLPPGGYDLEVRLAGTSTVVLPLGTLDLSADTNYEALAVGLVANSTLGAEILTSAVPAPAEVRVAHLSPDAPNVDVYVDGALVLADVPFLAVSDYLSVAPGPRQIQVTPAGAAQPVVIDAVVNLDAATSYTVAATGLLGANDLAPLVLVDDRVSSPSEVKVRFVHASPDAPGVDVAVTNGPVLFPGFTFRSASTYLAVPAGNYDLEVRLQGTNTVVLALPGVGLSAGTNITVFAVGLVGNSTLSALPVADVDETFLRGDSNRDGAVNLADVLVTLTSLFVAPVPGFCRDAADANDDGHLTITDAVYALDYLFTGGAAPLAPFPSPGTDATLDELDCR
ncbi:MAG: DUF4397 domain-containing protein [Planctomycetota bacterium]